MKAKREGGKAQVSPSEGPEAARAAGLRYVHDRLPGIRRRRAGRVFRYSDPKGNPVRDPETLSRLRSLAIPPAWTDVWVCPHPEGHIQATGRDARGRKQYLYHPRWREARDETKYHRLLAFGRALPRIRERLEADLCRRGLPREKVLAAVVRLLQGTVIRVGNEEYAKQNQSFGLTTLRDDHVEVQGSQMVFRFRAKSGRECQVEFRDPRLARIVRRCQELPGQALFQYLDDDGEQRTVTSDDVNEYLREITGRDFTAKDFRTWAGTLLAYEALKRRAQASDRPLTRTRVRREISQAIRSVSAVLGNTPTVCRRCYVHPAVLEAFAAGMLARARRPRSSAGSGLHPEERELLNLLTRLKSSA